MNFKNFSRTQFSKLRNGINAVWKPRYDTICSQNFVINLITGLEIVRGDQNFTQTHTHTHTHKERERERHAEVHFIHFLCENAETKLKMQQRSQKNGRKSAKIFRLWEKVQKNSLFVSCILCKTCQFDILKPTIIN